MSCNESGKGEQQIISRTHTKLDEIIRRERDFRPFRKAAKAPVTCVMSVCDGFASNVRN
jgi:hypothetical protein